MEEPAGWGAFPALWGAHLTGAGGSRLGLRGPVRANDGKAALEILGLTIHGAPGWVPRDLGVLGAG